MNKNDVMRRTCVL